MRHSKRSLEGEFLIDHRGSPGVDAELAAFMGLQDVASLLGKGQVLEGALVTCGHCQASVLMNPQRTRERGWCAHCDRYICDECAALLHLTLRCNTVVRRIDQIQEEMVRGTPPQLLTKL